jgi:hypothetical protein
MSPIFTYAAELYREMREEFELTVEAAHAAAEEGTRGAMLNKHGRAEGIDAYSLMTGPWSRVERYGSPELIEWCELHGRPSVARFEREWFTSWQGAEPLPEAEEFEPTKWYRAVFPNGDVWCESSDFAEVRRMAVQAPVAVGTLTVQRRFDRPKASEWRDMVEFQHKADC